MKTLRAIIERTIYRTIVWGSIFMILWSSSVIIYAAEHAHR